MIDRALAQQARAAVNIVPHHARQPRRGTGGDMIGRAKNRDRRHSRGRRDVHRPRIVGQIHRTGRRQVDEFGQGRFAGQAMGSRPRQLGNPLGELGLARGAENGNAGVQLA